MRFVVVALFFDALVPLLPAMAQNHGMSEAVFQALLGCCYVAFALAQLLSVPIIHALGLYRAAGLSCIALGLCAGGLCMAPNGVVFAGAFLAMFLVNSVGSNATRVAMRTAVGESAFKRLIAWASSAVELKQIAMPFIVGAIASAAGWRWALLALVAPIFLVGVWIEVERTVRGDKHDVSPVDRSGWCALLQEPRFSGPVLAMVGFQMVFAPLAVRLPFMLTGQASSVFSVGLVLSLANMTVAVGLAITGWLVPRVSSRALTKTGMVIMGLGCVLALVGEVHGPPWTVVGVIVVLSAFGFVMVPAMADALNVEAADRTSAAALSGFLQAVCSGTAVAMTGMVISDHGVVVVALTLVAIATVWISQRTG
ncbi:MFS transporter [Verminephrobacter aporrectodeae subsp. tuberculatae]|uniref:MFS transporter n=1 Tax=Verminephrobacter aporrectodeae TaxID=1110389 RepID=UPI0022449167|nr:MFS transporter [Verminephrobacter aporrectodeae]MCW8209072.1 MFS transporter [Verminephrobacter aporrectodeae subsp. tuberculatae]